MHLYGTWMYMAILHWILQSKKSHILFQHFFIFFSAERNSGGAICSTLLVPLRWAETVGPGLGEMLNLDGFENQQVIFTIPK